MNDGSWHHIALSRQGTTATLYIDGAVEGSGSTSGVTNIVNTADLLFGNDPCVQFGDGTQFYQGELDEIQYFNRALTQTEIQTIFQAGSAGQCKFPMEELTSLSPATLWIGLKNSDDQGTQFDLRTEVSINDTPVADGETHCITGVTRNPNKAKEVSVAFGPISDGGLTSGDVLSLTVLTRIGTNPNDTKCAGPGGSHANAVGLRLYYDATNRPSRFGAEITPEPLTDFFLHSDGADFFLDATPPTATSAKFKDSPAVNFADGNLWKEIGTWSMTLP